MAKTKITDFRVGDRVEIIGNCNGSVNRVGDIGIITAVNIETCIVQVDGRGTTCNNTQLRDMRIVEPTDRKPSGNKCAMCDSVDTFQRNKNDIWVCAKHREVLYKQTQERNMSKKPVGTPVAGIIKSKRTFGVELECLCESRDKYKMGLMLVPKAWGLKGDGSIRGSNTREIITCPMYGKGGEEMLTFGCDTLRSMDYLTNTSCGSHCHIGIPEALKNWVGAKDKLLEKRLKLLAMFYTVFDPVMLCMLPKERRTNGYCSPLGNRVVSIDKTTKELFGRFKEKEGFTSAITGYDDTKIAKDNLRASRGICGDRYGINFGSIYYRGTIEIRYHEGTLDAERLIHWIAFHSAIVDTCLAGAITEDQVLSYAKIEKVQKLFSALMDILNERLDESTVKYMTKRFNGYKKLNPKHGYIGTNFRTMSTDTCSGCDDCDMDCDEDY